MQVAGAINKAKKAEIVGNLTEKLQASTLVFGMEYQGIAVRAPAPVGASAFRCLFELAAQYQGLHALPLRDSFLLRSRVPCLGRSAPPSSVLGTQLKVTTRAHSLQGVLRLELYRSILQLTNIMSDRHSGQRSRVDANQAAGEREHDYHKEPIAACGC